MNLCVRFPTVGSSTGAGTAWSNPGSIVASNGQDGSNLTTGNTTNYAVAALAGAAVSAVLAASALGFDAGYDPVPADAAIKGVRVYVQGHGMASYAGASYEEVGLWDAGAFDSLGRLGQGYPIAPALGNVNYLDRFGSELELWASSLTAAKVRGAGFGAGLRVRAAAAGTVGVDCVGVGVFWEKPLQSVVEVTGDGLDAPCLVHCKAANSPCGADSPEMVFHSWRVVGPSGWDNTYVDPRAGMNGVVRSVTQDGTLFGPEMAFSCDRAGVYTVTHTVYSADGLSSRSSTHAVTIGAESNRPVRHLSPAGSDAADGLTPGTAWATMAKALSSSPAHCVVELAAGTYPFNSGGGSTLYEDLVFRCAAPGAAVLNCSTPPSFYNVQRMLFHRVRVTGASFAGFLGNGTVSCNDVGLLDTSNAAMAGFMEQGKTGPVCKRFVAINHVSDGTERYAWYVDSFDSVVLQGCRGTLSATNPAEGFVRAIGYQGSALPSGFGHQMLYCLGLGAGSTQSFIRQMYSYAHAGACADRKAGNGVAPATTWYVQDPGTPRVFFSYVSVVDACDFDGPVEFECLECGVVRSTVSRGNSLTLRSTGRVSVLASTFHLPAGWGGDQYVVLKDCVRGGAGMVSLKQNLFTAEGAPQSWQLFLREFPTGSTGAGNPDPAVVGLGASSRNIFPAWGGARYRNRTGQLTAAQWNASGYSDEFITLNAAAAAPGVAPTDPALRAGGVPLAGVHRDYRLQWRTRTGGWSRGASGVEAPGSVTPPAPDTVPPPPPENPVVPGAVSGFAVAVNGLSASASWQPAANASAYVLERRATAPAAGEWESVVVQSTSHAWAESIADTTYEARVTPVSSQGVHGPTASALPFTTINPTPIPPLPGVLSVTKADAVDGGVDLEWTKSANATDHVVQLTSVPAGFVGAYTPPESAWSSAYFAGADELAVQLTNLVNGTRYLVRVLGSNGRTRASAAVEFTPGPVAPVAPAQVTGVSLAAAVRGFSVSFDAAADAAKYEVFYGPTGSGLDAVALVVGTGPHAVGGLQAMTEYTVRVRGVSAQNVRGSFSAAAAVTTQVGAPGVPLNLSGVAGVGEAILTWSPGADAASSEVHASSAQNGTYALAATVAASTARVAAAAGVARWFKVRSVNAAGVSAFTAAVSVTPLSPPPPPPTPAPLPPYALKIRPAGPTSPLLYCQTAIDLAQSGWMASAIALNPSATRLVQANFGSVVTINDAVCAAAADELADQIEAVGYFKDRGDEGGGQYAGGFLLPNFANGNVRTQESVTNHPSDLLASGTADNTLWTPLANAGMVEAARWSRVIAEKLREECDARALAYPAFYIDDNEGDNNEGVWRVGTALRHKVGATFYGGWWPAYKASAAFNDPARPLLAVRRGDGGPEWLTGAQVEARFNPPAYDGNLYWTHATNRPFILWLNGIGQLATASRLCFGPFLGFREVFPGMGFGNYNDGLFAAFDPGMPAFSPDEDFSFLRVTSPPTWFDLSYPVVRNVNSYGRRLPGESAREFVRRYVREQYARVLADARTRERAVQVIAPGEAWNVAPVGETAETYTFTHDDYVHCGQFAVTIGVYRFVAFTPGAPFPRFNELNEAHREVVAWSQQGDGRRRSTLIDRRAMEATWAAVGGVRRRSS